MAILLNLVKSMTIMKRSGAERTAILKQSISCLYLCQAVGLLVHILVFSSASTTIDGITSTWTIDGRIVCLLENGRKATVQTDSDLANVRQQCRR